MYQRVPDAYYEAVINISDSAASGGNADSIPLPGNFVLNSIISLKPIIDTKQCRD